MAKRKPNRAPLFAFLAVSAAVLAGLGWWITTDLARQSAEDKQAAKVVPQLPGGRMRVVHTSATEVRYLAIDEVRPAANGRVAAKVLRVGRSPNVFDDRASMIVRYETLDCASGQIFEGRIGEFDHTGRLFVVTKG